MAWNCGELDRAIAAAGERRVKGKGKCAFLYASRLPTVMSSGDAAHARP